MTYSSGGPQPLSGSLNVTQQGDNYFGTLGPFPQSAGTAGAPRPINVQVVATDAAGNQAQGSTTVQLQRCNQ
jgi:hypothetical protein